MVEVTFDLRVEGEEKADAFLDPYEVNALFENTRASIRRGLAHKLGDLVCEEHGEAPRITVSGVYSYASEDMELNYHIDTCCKLFLVRVMKTLNMQG